VEIRIADNGEVLVRGVGLLKATTSARRHREAINAEGYFLTGDAGVIDADGHLKIIDRAKDVGKLADGAMFAPNYIENKLKFFQHIKEAVAFGTDRDRVCAFINIDFDAVGNWAERRHLPMPATPTWPPARRDRDDRRMRRAGQRRSGRRCDAGRVADRAS
jgi:long-chain acyl-CoA synthetase